MNINPPSPKIWRNYNYPLGQVPRYPGTFRIKTKMAIRASTAAPTFFTPIQWNGGLYCDGALVANNPTAIAVQEAKVRNKHNELKMIIHFIHFKLLFVTLFLPGFISRGSD